MGRLKIGIFSLGEGGGGGVTITGAGGTGGSVGGATTMGFGAAIGMIIGVNGEVIMLWEEAGSPEVPAETAIIAATILCTFPLMMFTPPKSLPRQLDDNRRKKIRGVKK